jgi:hypothetical protein
MTKVLISSGGKVYVDGGKVQIIPGGSTADDCTCCGPGGCVPYPCPPTGDLQSWDFDVSFPSSVVLWRYDTLQIRWQKATLTGWSGLNGTYTSTLGTGIDPDGVDGDECEYNHPSGSATITWTIQNYGVAGDGCPDLTNPLGLPTSTGYPMSLIVLGPYPNINLRIGPTSGGGAPWSFVWSFVVTDPCTAETVSTPSGSSSCTNISGDFVTLSVDYTPTIS